MGTKKRKQARRPQKINLRRSVRLKHGLWSKWAVDQIDQRTFEGKWAKAMREEYLRELGCEPSLDERLALDHLIIDALKKRKYDEGILEGRLYGSRDMGQAISESLTRRIMKRMGMKRNEKKVLDLTDYLNSKKSKGGERHE